MSSALPGGGVLVAVGVAAAFAYYLSWRERQQLRALLEAATQGGEEQARSASTTGTPEARSAVLPAGGPSEAHSGKRTLRSAVKRAHAISVVRRRFSGEALFSPTTQDTPLQKAIASLKGFGHLLEQEDRGEEAETVFKIISMLRDGHVHKRGSGKAIVKEMLKDATPEEGMGMKAWVADDEEVTGPMVSTANVAAHQHSGLASRVMKWTRKMPKLVLGGNEALLAQMLEHDVLSWEFDMNRVQALSGGHAMVAIGWALCERHGLRAKLDLRTDAVLELLIGIETAYRPVAYHNSVHGADVTHAMHWLMCSAHMWPIVKDDPLLLFTALLAAITHDLGHDGYNNAFHINSNSPLAVASCYHAPLERHHLASAFALLAQPDSLLGRMPLTERKQVQTWMREIVLATDFAVHMEVINEFKTLIDLRGVMTTRNDDGEAVTAATRQASMGGERPLADFEGDEKILTLKMAIKTADLGYLTKGRQYCQEWTENVLEEFFTQGDTEKRLGLPVSFGCDRDHVDIPQSQLGFYQFMIDPLYKAMDLLVPLEQQLTNLDVMRSLWQARKDSATTAK